MAPVCMWTEQTRFSQTEAIMGLNKQRIGIWRLSLEQIEATVADHLGRGRVPGIRRRCQHGIHPRCRLLALTLCRAEAKSADEHPAVSVKVPRSARSGPLRRQ